MSIRFTIVLGGVAALCVAGAVVSAEKRPAASPFVGTARCQACHPGQHETWAASKHSKAMRVLSASEKKDPECFKCHVTGYGMPGGFVSLEKTPEMSEVGCEACHGGGSVHVDAPMEEKKRTISVNGLDCRTCHHPHLDVARKKK